MSTNIEWTDETWNPIRGCSRVSEGCRNCYAERQAARFSGPGMPYEGLVKRTSHGPAWTGEVRVVPELLDAPLRWKKPRRVFVNSMSDMFHEKVPDEAIERILGVTIHAKAHTFQILTKRPERMRSVMRRWTDMNGRPQPNLWLGVSVEDQTTADERIPLLLQTPAAVRFVSYEPALGPINIDRWLRPRQTPNASGYEDEHAPGWTTDFSVINWLIVGGESGPSARPCDVAWIRSAVQQCKAAGVPCFVKQIGAGAFETLPSIKQLGSAGALAAINERRAHIPGWTLTHTPDGKSCFFRSLNPCDRKGGDPTEWPADLRVREMPR